MSGVVPASGPWHLGYIIGIPVLSLVLIALVVGAGLLFREARREKRKGYGGDWAFLALLPTFFAVLLAGVLVWAVLPLDTDFHQYRHVSGTVERVESRMVAQGKGMSQRFVVVIAGRPFAVDDTRATLVRPGDTINLSCSKEWVYASDSGWACNWGAP